MDRGLFMFIAVLVSVSMVPAAADTTRPTGTTLAPDAEHELEGLASWYGGKFQGRLTANGEVFDTNQLTAAHKTLPFGTVVRVINAADDRSVVVRINDRGPFVEGRVIDLSRAAAVAIGVAAAGIAPVRVEIVHRVVEPTTRTIQVAAFSQRSNALALVARLEQHGFRPALEDAGSGIHRVLLQEVPIPEIDDHRGRLATLGYTSVLVRSR